MGYCCQKVFNENSIVWIIEYMHLQVVVKEKEMLEKKSNISKQDIFNLQSDIIKRWREDADEKNKILISTTIFSI